MMDTLQLTPENIDREHICCAISDKKGDPCVAAKKDWLKGRFAEGLVFRRLDARGKVFMEYIPAEMAWVPIHAPGYLYIDCFWVSGQYQGQGYANQLLGAAMADAKAQGKAGLVALSSPKKKPFLSDPGYLKYKGFQVADSAKPYFELLYLPLEEESQKPTFLPCAKEGKNGTPGMVIYYTHQCPFTALYAPKLQAVAQRMGQELALVRFDTREEAQAAFSPFTTYSFFDHGQFVTQEIFSEKKMEKYLSERA